MERTIDRLVAGAKKRWPAVQIPSRDFVEYVGSRLGDKAQSIDWSALQMSDLYLACGCARGERGAGEVFVREFTRDVEGVFTRSQQSCEPLEDFCQRVWEYVLVTDGTRPRRIAGYQGRGKLRYWLRIVAARQLPNVNGPAPIDLGLLPAPSDPPEDAYIRQLYREPFEAAMREAFAQLSDRHRTLLRYHFIERMPQAAIAAMLQVHRVTVSHWLRDARSDLLWRTRAALATRVGLPRAEWTSLVRLVRSEVGVSVGRLLAPSC